MRSVQINRGDEERKETCEDQRDDLTLLSLSHHRTTHWWWELRCADLQSSPTRQPGAAECVWISRVAAGKDERKGARYLCSPAQQHGRVGLCERLQQGSMFGPWHPFTPTCANRRKRPKVDPKLRHDKRLNPLKLTPSLPPVFPHKRTQGAQMFPNRRGIQKRNVVLNARKKLALSFFHAVFFFFNFPHRSYFFPSPTYSCWIFSVPTFSYDK